MAALPPLLPKLIVLISFALAVVAAPNVTSVTKVDKVFTELRQDSTQVTKTAWVIEMTLDDDVSFGVPCTGANDILPIIKPCTGASNCLSRATREFDIPANGASKDFFFQIANSNNCTSGFEIIADMVNVGANVAYKANYTLPIWQRNVDHQSKKAIYVCCSYARALIPNFTATGIVPFSLVNRRSDGAFSRVRVRLEGDGKLDIKDWFEIVPLSATCSYSYFNQTLNATIGSVLSCQSNVSTLDGKKACETCCPNVNLQPTNDALMLYLLNKQAPVNSSGAFGSTIGFRDKARTFTFFFTYATLEGGELKYQLNEGLNVTQCTFSLDLLYDSHGEVLNRNVNKTATELQLVCNYENFEKVRRGFELVTAELGDPTGKSFDEIASLSFLARAYPQSDDWQACEDLALSLVTETIKNSSVSTTECFSERLSEEWSKDPCCNPAYSLALSECCAERTVQKLEESFPPSLDALAQSQCYYRSCARDSLTQFGELQSARRDAYTGCAALTQKYITSKEFTTNPIDDCLAKYFGVSCNPLNGDADCRTKIDPSSVCQRNGLCSQSCRLNSDCVSDNCDTSASPRSCVFYQQNDDSALAKAANCLATESSDPYLRLLLQEELTKFFKSNSSNITAPATLTYLDMLQAILRDYECVGPYLDPAVGRTMSQDECELASFCNINGCRINSSPTCNEATCVNSNTSYCADCRGERGDVCLGVSRAECVVLDPFYRGNKADCLDLVGHSYNPSTKACINSPSSNRNSCLQPCPTAFEYDLFEDTFFSCKSFCWAERDFFTNSSCPPGWIDLNVSITGSRYTHKCLISGPSRTDCINAPNFTWYPGYTWVALYLQNDTCTGYCDGNSFAFNESRCLSRGSCSAECFDCTGPECTVLGTCEDAGGSCIKSLPNAQQECQPGFRWTPKGCANVSIDTLKICNASGGTWYPASTVEGSCLSTEICRTPSAFGSIDILSQGIPQGFTLQNRTECERCGGISDSFFRWSPATYSSNSWYTFTWKPRAITKATWELRVNPSTYNALFSKVQAKRFAPVQQSELLCLFGQSSAILGEISCNCGERAVGSNCTQALIATKATLVGVELICQGIVAEIKFANTTLFVEDTFVSPSQNSSCVLITANQFSLFQFSNQTQIQLSSISIKSTQSQLGDKRFFTNDNGIVVAQMIGDGMSYVSNGGPITGGVIGCFPVKRESVLGPLVVLFYATFVRSKDFEDFTEGRLSELSYGPVVNLDTTLDDQFVCMVVTGDDYTYFPVGLVSDWKSRQYVNSWFVEDLIFIFIGALAYTALLGFSIFFLVLHIKEGGPLLQLPKMTLAVMVIFCLNRMLYFWMLPFGVLSSVQAVNTIFVELPILFFLSVYSFIVIRWAEIYHYAMESSEEGRLRWVVLIGNAFMYVFFIIVMILFFTKYNSAESVEINCSNVDTISSASNRITPAQIIGLVYKIFFIVTCLLMAGAFAFYGSKIIGRLKAGSAVSTDAQKKRFRKLLIASSVCTIALVLDAANLLVGNFEQQIKRPNWAIMLCVYIIEIAPSGLILSMFKKNSGFTQKVKSKLSASSSTKLKSSKSKLGLGSSANRLDSQNSTENDERQISLKIKSDSKMTTSTDPSRGDSSSK